MDITVNFKFEKETPGTHKFKEVPAHGQPPVMKTAYLPKHFIESHGVGDEFTLTLHVPG